MQATGYKAVGEMPPHVGTVFAFSSANATPSRAYGLSDRPDAQGAAIPRGGERSYYMTSSHLQASERADAAQRQARKAANHPWVVLLARFGYAAKGVVYLIIGGLAAASAMGVGGATTDRNGAVQAIYAQRFGAFMLVLVAIGWLGYALWSELQATLDTEHAGRDAKGIVKRLGYAAVGLSYAGLAIGALRLVVGAGNGGANSNAQTQDWTARLMSIPLGVVLVVLVGLVVLAIAGMLFYQAYSASFARHLDLSDASANLRDGAVWLGRLGYAALGGIFTVIGVFLVVAALRHNPGAAIGLSGALGALVGQPFGHLLLGLVALGLIAYGAYSFVEARYRRVGPA